MVKMVDFTLCIAYRNKRNLKEKNILERETTAISGFRRRNSDARDKGEAGVSEVAREAETSSRLQDRRAWAPGQNCSRGACDVVQTVRVGAVTDREMAEPETGP